MTDQTKCVIVIPIYQTNLSHFERISFEQCLNILGDFQIVIVKPTSLPLPDFLKNGTSAISFDDEYFEDIHGYNRLMMSEKFYAQFLTFEYLLIYQLDAFVFSNDLEHWCNRGYDYIGAPWLRQREFNSTYKRYKENLKSFFHRRYNIIEKNGRPALDKQVANQVGNGGFSLRKTQVFHHICISKKSKIDQYLSKRDAYFNEDIFFSIEINRRERALRIPDYRIAIAFAFETMLPKALQLNHQELPFGCHAWDKQIDFWRPYFKQIGYNI